MNAAAKHTMLRPYQTEGKNEVYAAWNCGYRNVLAVYPTGAGKTVLLADIVHAHVGASCVIAHRQELVSQISIALARDGVLHKIIGPENVIKGIVQLHMEELGRCFYDPKAQHAVAGVDTILSWSKEGNKHREALLWWAAQVTLVVQDEAHHLLLGNKWGQALNIFPNARLLGVTATPERADGKGLGRDYDGVFDHMVVGPGMRDLIRGVADNYGGTRSFLTDYRVFCPPNNLDLDAVNTGTDGDYIRKQLALKTKESTVLGDVVEHYLRLARGKLGITFVPDVETAIEMSQRFNAAGVPAEVVTAKTPNKVRRHILRRFARREILQLVNVDLFGEGFDLPAIEVVSMARATQSYALFVQMFGRALRLMDGKEWALIIDHVGNVLRHGLPDRPRKWTLARRDKKAAAKADDTIPMRNCTGGVYADGTDAPGCFQPYEAFHPACPYCGCKKVPAGRTAPEMVEGDLFELDQETLRAMRGEVAVVDMHRDEVVQKYAHMGAVIAGAQANRHVERQEAQAALRGSIQWWAAWHSQTFGRPDSEIYRRFWFKFGLDMLSAQSLGRADAELLQVRVAADIAEMDAEYRRLCA